MKLTFVSGLSFDQLILKVMNNELFGMQLTIKQLLNELIGCLSEPFEILSSCLQLITFHEHTFNFSFLKAALIVNGLFCWQMVLSQQSKSVDHRCLDVAVEVLNKSLVIFFE